MRIAVGGIHIECSTYNPVLNEEKDFRIVRQAELLAAPYFQFLKDYPATFLPTVHARAIAGGPVSRATYDKLKAEMLDGLRAHLPFDGLYLAMHGAMYVEGMEDAEGDWIAAARVLSAENYCAVCTVEREKSPTVRWKSTARRAAVANGVVWIPWHPSTPSWKWRAKKACR